MSVSKYVTPKTAVKYLLNTGMTLAEVGRFSGLARNTLYKVLRMPDYHRYQGATVDALQAAYARRFAQIAESKKVTTEVE